MPDDHCRRLVEEAHARGITVVSWWPMNHNKTALALHPDWAIQPLPDPERSGGRPDYPPAIYPCPTSPYRGLLYDLVAEALAMTGIDGFFFDGATFGYNGGPFQMACGCGRCAVRFEAATGLRMPARVDFADPAFRRFIRWEYDLWRSYVRGLADAIHAVKPGAYIGLNVFNRPPDLDFRGGTPLEELEGCDVTVCAELGWTPNHPYEASSLLCKVFRAMQAGRPGGAELYAGSPVWLEIWDEHALPYLVANGLAAIALNCCVSYGTDQPVAACGDTVPRLTLALARPRQYAGGDPIPYIAVHLSGQAKDFACQMQHMRYWDRMHAVHEILAEAHLPFDYVLDNQLRPGYLDRYPILLLPESTCLSHHQSQAIQAYVEHGGIALAGGAFAAANEWGEPWPSGGLELRTFFGVNQTAGVLARGAAWSEPLLVEQRRGKGIAAYIDIDLGQTYLDQPDERLARFIADWLTRQVPPPITLDGPWCAILEAYAWSPSEWRVHLDNNRSRVHRSWRNAPDALAPIVLRGNGKPPLRARLLIGDAPLECRETTSGWDIPLPTLPRYEIVQIQW